MLLNPLQYSCLENPMDRRAWQATGGRKESDTTEGLTHTHTAQRSLKKSRRNVKKPGNKWLKNTSQNLWDAAKAVLRAKFTAIKSYCKKQDKSQLKNLTLYPKQLEKEEQTKHKVSRKKEIIKIRTELNKIETKKKISEINKTQSWFFEKKNKIYKPLARLINKKRERTQISKLKMKMKLQLTPHKYHCEHCMPIKWTPGRNGQIPRKVVSLGWTRKKQKI